MTTFVDAVRNTETLTHTENGMTALKSSLRASTDLFYKVGSSRGQDLTSLFEKTIQEDVDIAMRLAQWVRDVRGGAGERKMFRQFMSHLEQYHPDLITNRLLRNIREVGRFDDLLIFTNPSIRQRAFEQIAEALINDRNGLAAKWMPRKGPVAAELRTFLGLTPKQYRKLLVGLTKVVETKMCAKEWDQIIFDHVPSLAMKRYTKAFKRNAQEHFEAYKAKLASGEAKVNASAVYPYQVIQQLRNDQEVGDAMWKALPNYMTDAAVLPLVDVSSSMSCAASGLKGTTCMDVALSLGLYCADKNQGSFKDLFLTFTSTPRMEHLKGTISQKLHQLSRCEWMGSTDIQAAFEEILRVAKKNNVPEREMPKILLILSDMQFNQACSFGGLDYFYSPTVSPDDSAIKMFRKQYEAAGYQMPRIVFWNLAGNRGSNDNMPVKFNEHGTALVSGFSPSIMRAVLAADMESFTPENVMKTALMIDRYDWR